MVEVDDPWPDPPWRVVASDGEHVVRASGRKYALCAADGSLVMTAAGGHDFRMRALREWLSDALMGAIWALPDRPLVARDRVPGRPQPVRPAAAGRAGLPGYDPAGDEYRGVLAVVVGARVVVALGGSWLLLQVPGREAGRWVTRAFSRGLGGLVERFADLGVPAELAELVGEVPADLRATAAWARLASVMPEGRGLAEPAGGARGKRRARGSGAGASRGGATKSGGRAG